MASKFPVITIIDVIDGVDTIFNQEFFHEIL